MSKETKKSIIQNAYMFISILLAFVSAVWLWYWNVGVGWDKGYFGVRTLVTVGILYCLVYFAFSRMYRAHKIGMYHLTELAFSQMLSYGIADAALYGAAFCDRFFCTDIHNLGIDVFFEPSPCQI